MRLIEEGGSYVPNLLIQECLGIICLVSKLKPATKKLFKEEDLDMKFALSILELLLRAEGLHKHTFINSQLLTGLIKSLQVAPGKSIE